MPSLRTSLPFRTGCQLLAALFMLWTTRLLFVAYNYDLVEVRSLGELARLAAAGLLFDLSAVVYFNAPFLLLRLLPFPFVRMRGCRRLADACYCVANSLLLAINIADIPFFRFAGSRLRWSSLADVAADPNWTGIALSYLRDYWWTYLLAIGCIALTIRLYNRLNTPPHKNHIYLKIRNIYPFAA